MLSKVVIFFGVVIVLMGMTHYVLQSGELLSYMDSHRDAGWVPTVEYYIGETYFLFQSTEQASVFFRRVIDRYPKSSHADDANFDAIQCLEDSPITSRATLIDEYQKYLERFPAGKYITLAQNRIDVYKNGGGR